MKDLKDYINENEQQIDEFYITPVSMFSPEWQLVSPSVLYTGQGVPNNAQGNNGDIYMQTD